MSAGRSEMSRSSFRDGPDERSASPLLQELICLSGGASGVEFAFFRLFSALHVLLLLKQISRKRERADYNSADPLSKMLFAKL